jgi:DNA-directed RNA polymerase subunit RPC12/RpoP
MTIASRRFVLQSGLLGVACACLTARIAVAAEAPAPSPSGKYVCPPCGCAADGKEFDAPGACPECGMPLVPKPAEPTPKAAAPKAQDDGSRGVIAVAHRKEEIGWGTRTRT